MPPSEPLDDPLRNLWVGCLWPIARNLLQVAVVFVVSAYAMLRLDSIWFLLGGMFLGATLLWIFERKVFRKRHMREREASARLLGLPFDPS